MAWHHEGLGLHRSPGAGCGSGVTSKPPRDLDCTGPPGAGCGSGVMAKPHLSSHIFYSSPQIECGSHLLSSPKNLGGDDIA